MSRGAARAWPGRRLGRALDGDFPLLLLSRPNSRCTCSRNAANSACNCAFSACSWACSARNCA